MTTDFLIGAIRASRDLHPLVKDAVEEILVKAEQETRLKDLPRAERKRLNRIVRLQRKNWRSHERTDDR